MSIKHKSRGEAIAFAVYCINSGIPLDQLTEEEEYNEALEEFRRIINEH